MGAREPANMPDLSKKPADEARANQPRANPILTNKSLTAQMWKSPVVTLGVLCTGGVLAYGMMGMVKGNGTQSRAGMGMRVGFQFVTIAALLGYMAFSGQGPVSSAIHKLKHKMGFEDASPAAGSHA